MAIALSKLYKPRLSVEIDGVEGRLPAVRFNSTFELNSIPQAGVSIAVGREFRTGIPSQIHAIADALGEERRKVKVVLSMEPEGAGGGGGGNPALGIAPGEFTIFDGFTGAVAASFANGSAQYTVQLDHWLSDLSFSSVFSKTSHPGNPGDYTFGALSGGTSGGGGAGPGGPTGRHWIGLTHAMDHFDAGKVASDFWLEALKPWFEALCKQDGFEAREKNLKGSGANDQALAALARMGGGGCYSPLRLDLAVDKDIGRIISDDVTAMTQDPEDNAHITIWDTLVAKFAAEYLFSVVPLVDRALVVPFVPGYRRAFKVIPAAHETQVEWTSMINRRLRGVAVLSGMDMASGPGLGPPNADTHPLGIGGLFEPDADAKGTLQIKAGPRWVGGLFSASEYADEATGAAGSPIPDNMVPGVAAPRRDGAVAGRAVVVKEFLDRYAQALYALEMIRGRSAIAAGPVRFDIAPGSTILAYPSGGAADGDDRLKAPFYATVLRVSTYLDAESAQAGTGFHLAHCRSERENSSDRASVDKHPLYRDTFAGCGLLG